MRYQGDQNMESQPRIRTSRPERGRQQVWCSFHEDTLVLSSPPASLWLAPVTDVTLPWHLSAFPSRLAVPSPSLRGGTVCFLEVCLWGEGIPCCSRPPLVFQLITQNMTALLFFGAEMSCFARPRGGVKIFLLRSLLLELHFKTADRYCVRELPALGRVHKHCVIFAAMRFEVMYQFSPRGMNVSLNAVISRYFFFSTLKTVLEWKFILTKSGSLSYWGWRLKCINCSKSKWVAKHPQKCKYLYFIGHRFHYNGVITF